MHKADSSHGFTLVELLSVVTLISIAAALAVPIFRGTVERVRVQTALDLLVGQLYRTRMMAVEDGGPVQLFMVSDAEGCTRALRLQRTLGRAEPLVSSSQLDLPELCLRHSGDSVVVFDGRGMLRPPTRSFYIRRRTTADSVVISIAGRVRRSYRRARRAEKHSAPGNRFRGRLSVARRKCRRNNGFQAGTELTSAPPASPNDRRSSCRLRRGSEKLRSKSNGAGSHSPLCVSGETAAPTLAALRLRREGFSLIEILVAMVILSFALLGLQGVMMSATRAVATADRQSRFAVHAADSMEAALHLLRMGSHPSQLCVTIPPFGDRLSRRVAVAGKITTVTVTVLPSSSHRPSPQRPFELTSSILVPASIAATVTGSACS